MRYEYALINEFKSFYHPAADDDSFYHTTCNYHVKCKFLPHRLVANILNKEIYGMDFDTYDLKHIQKSNLDLNLKQASTQTVEIQLL
ncbi:unnamed protein product [Rhizophagus irregularis]|nr:unnamed protein product [Rhizophagus irregularis]CAB4444228.1 unnamed protein product [Rhizophagus irregularis]